MLFFILIAIVIAAALGAAWYAVLLPGAAVLFVFCYVMDFYTRWQERKQRVKWQEERQLKRDIIAGKKTAHLSADGSVEWKDQ